jgi:hypothetical protein
MSTNTHITGKLTENLEESVCFQAVPARPSGKSVGD